MTVQIAWGGRLVPVYRNSLRDGGGCTRARIY